MNKILILLCFCLFSLVATATPVGPMNYQGRLLDAQGIPVTGSYNFVVRVYDDPTTGILKYQEEHAGVAVDDGVYAFKIGLGPKTGGDSEWDLLLWQSNMNDLFLEMTVGAETLTPRHELTSAPHAYTATFALAADTLGGKTVADFNNVFEGVCVVGGGKWLNKVGRCLGRDADFSAAATLADLMDPVDTNFSKLDLSGADISGIELAGVNFTGTRFVGTQVNLSKMANTNLTDTHWEDATNVGALPSSPVNFTNGWVKNLSGLAASNFSAANFTNFSAARLPQCPSALPANWTCIEEAPAGSLSYFLAGPGANLSAGSALANNNFGTYTLPLQPNSLSNLNLSGANFDGVALFNQTISNTNLQNASFDYAELKYMKFTGSDLTGMTVNRTDLTGTTLPGTVSYNDTFVDGVSINVGEGETYTVTGSVLNNSSIILAAGATLNLNGVTLVNTPVTSSGYDNGANTTVNITNSSALVASSAAGAISATNVTVTGSTLNNADINAVALVLNTSQAVDVTLHQTKDLAGADGSLQIIDSSISNSVLNFNVLLNVQESTLTNIPAGGIVWSAQSAVAATATFDYVTFTGAKIDFGLASATATSSTLTVDHSEFAAGIVVTFNTYPASGAKMYANFKNSNFLSTVSFNGQNGVDQMHRSSTSLQRFVFESNHFINPNFTSNMYSFGDLNANLPVFYNNTFNAGDGSSIFSNRMDLVLFTHNTFYITGGNSTYLFPQWWSVGPANSECAGVLSNSAIYSTYGSYLVTSSQVKAAGQSGFSRSSLGGVEVRGTSGTGSGGSRPCDICTTSDYYSTNGGSPTFTNTNTCPTTAAPAAPTGRGDPNT